MASNEFKQTKTKINDTVYTLQMAPASWVLEIMDTCRDEVNGRLLQKDFAENILEVVVIDPRKKIDDFTGDIKNLNLLIKAVEAFLLGNKVPGEVKDQEKN